MRTRIVQMRARCSRSMSTQPPVPDWRRTSRQLLQRPARHTCCLPRKVTCRGPACVTLCTSRTHRLWSADRQLAHTLHRSQQSLATPHTCIIQCEFTHLPILPGFRKLPSPPLTGKSVEDLKISRIRIAKKKAFSEQDGEQPYVCVSAS